VAEALVIAIVGAESTGKTALAQALSQRLASLTRQRCTWVGEWLRQWCDEQRRTPQAHEQAAIARTQQAHIDAAAATHDIVVADTTPLMTAVYSHMLFDDDSLLPYAVQQHRGYTLTLLTALDLPWVADGLQRDGPHVREPVDARVRAALRSGGVPFSLVAGSGALRVDSALAAVQPWLRRGGAD